MAYDKAVVLLLAHGFREGAIITCLEQMREAGLAVTVVGLTAGLISGQHGLAVQPDLSLNQLQRQPSSAPDHQLLVLPDGRRSALALGSDPRVHRLIETIYHRGGIVATMMSEPSLLDELNRRFSSRRPQVTPSKFLCRGHQPVETFVQQLMDVLEPKHHHSSLPERVACPKSSLHIQPN